MHKILIVCKHLPRIAVKSYNDVSCTNETTYTHITNFQSAAYLSYYACDRMTSLINNKSKNIVVVCQTETAMMKKLDFPFYQFSFWQHLCVGLIG